MKLYELNHSKILINNNLIIIRPEKRSLYVAMLQGIVSGLIFIIFYNFASSMHFFILIAMFFVAMFLFILSILGLIYSIWGSKSIINGAIKKIIWQQGLFGLGIGTEKAVSFKKIKNVEICIDVNEQNYAHNFFLIEINVISNDDIKTNLVSEFGQRAYLDTLSIKINAIAEEIVNLIGCELILPKT